MDIIWSVFSGDGEGKNEGRVEGTGDKTISGRHKIHGERLRMV